MRAAAVWGPMPFHRRADGGAALEGGTLGDQDLDGGVDEVDLALGGDEHGLEGGGQLFAAGAAGRFGAVLFGDPDGDQVAAAPDHRLQPHEQRVGGAPQRQARPALAAIGGELGRIDGIAFAERAEGADEGLELQRVAAVNRQPGPEAFPQQQRLMAAGRLANGEVGAAALEEGAEGGAAVGDCLDRTAAVRNDDRVLASRGSDVVDDAGRP